MGFTRARLFSHIILFKIRIWQALRTGPPYRSRMNRIIIDLTHYCDLSCSNCNRSCGKDQAPSREVISADQIRKFTEESINRGIKWERIWLEGGEPALHPDLDEIFSILLRYKSDFFKNCEITLCTNGNSDKAKEMYHSHPEGIIIKNSFKSAIPDQAHFPFNTAPSDIPEFANADFTRGCYIHKIFGLGLNRYGYYPHPVCGSIDRVFGFDIGKKKIPESAESMSGQMDKLCRYCGHFIEYHKGGKIDFKSIIFKNRYLPHNSISDIWVKAYSKYKKNKPSLKLY